MKPIKNQKDYQMALVKIQLLEESTLDEQQKDELEVLHILVEHYERENAPMGMPDPIDSIKIFNEFLTDNNKDK
ncbi:hypothetical protein ACYSNX_12700 [Myroides sp. LJL115]